jgi:hypothetical protein
LPIVPIAGQSGNKRIVQNVLDDSGQFFTISDHVIVAFILPKGAASPKYRVRLKRRMPL